MLGYDFDDDNQFFGGLDELTELLPNEVLWRNFWSTLCESQK